jgi:osmotically-inducible protein OsmY
MIANVIKKPRAWYHTALQVRRPTGARSVQDRRLARKICSIFERELNPEIRSSLAFYVRNNAVSIFGSVCSPADRGFIADLIKRIPGVRDVRDHTSLVDYEDVY